MRRILRLSWAALLVIGMACGGSDDGDGGGGNGPDVSIAKSGAPNGDAQTSVVASAVTDSLRVLVQEDGIAKAGVTVTWAAQGPGATVSPATSVTDANGLAATRYTLGTRSGAQTARATLAGASGSPVTFNATATPDEAASFTAAGGDGQSVAVSSTFPAPLLAKVADQYGNGIAGITVTWVVQSGPVTVSGGATSVTSDLGLASKTIVSGAVVGNAVVRATNPVVAGNVDFNLAVAVQPVAVSFGDFFFSSDRNGSSDPAVDTTVVGRAVRWTNTLGTHTVQSIASPSFTSSDNLVGQGATYTITFNSPGTYQYNCSIHGSDMTGRVVVLP